MIAAVMTPLAACSVFNDPLYYPQISQDGVKELTLEYICPEAPESITWEPEAAYDSGYWRVHVGGATFLVIGDDDDFTIGPAGDISQHYLAEERARCSKLPTPQVDGVS